MKNKIKKLIQEAVAKLYPNHSDIVFSVDYAPFNIDADFASNVAMVVAKKLGKRPMEVAEEIANYLSRPSATLPSQGESDSVDASVAKPGFLNFKIDKEPWIEELGNILEEKEKYGSSDQGRGKKINVEFVSANPTGPLTVGHGRGAVIGLALSNILRSQGYEVIRDYYYNDGGLQMKRLGESVRLRVRQQLKESIGESFENSEPIDIYMGAYINEIAEQFIRQKKLKTSDDATVKEYSDFAAQIIFSGIKDTLHKLGIGFDNYFNELSLFDKEKKGNIWEILEVLKEKGIAYEKEGAVWLKGASEDRVLIRSTGEPTYRLPDIAYHTYKLRLGYERIVNILGADHIAQFPDVKFAVKTLGYDDKKIQVIINQFVTLDSGKKMSTRKANYVTLDELLEEVGPSVTKFFMLMSAPGTHMNFDMDLAKDTSEKNPVYKVQYAHARISSIIRKSGASNTKPKLEILNSREELAVIRELGKYPELVSEIAETYNVHHLPHYLLGLAERFHGFYERVRVISEDEQITIARLSLVKGVQTVLANGLRFMGIKPLKRM